MTPPNNPTNDKRDSRHSSSSGSAPATPSPNELDDKSETQFREHFSSTLEVLNRHFGADARAARAGERYWLLSAAALQAMERLLLPPAGLFDTPSSSGRFAGGDTADPADLLAHCDWVPVRYTADPAEGVRVQLRRHRGSAALPRIVILLDDGEPDFTVEEEGSDRAWVRIPDLVEAPEHFLLTVKDDELRLFFPTEDDVEAPGGD